MENEIKVSRNYAILIRFYLLHSQWVNLQSSINVYLIYIARSVKGLHITIVKVICFTLPLFINMLPNAYLTDRQQEIWSLRLKGLSKAKIGRMLGITRQAVYDAEGVMLEKIELALTHTAESNMIEPKYVDSTQGILLGYSPQTKQKVIITYSTRNGVQTWHYQQPNCANCEMNKKCTTRLIEEANERGLPLKDKEMSLPPSELAQSIFSRLIPELKL